MLLFFSVCLGAQVGSFCWGDGRSRKDFLESVKGKR